MKFNNLYWQVLNTDQTAYYFTEAFLDVRQQDSKGSLVRILGMVEIQKYEEKEDLHCHFWFNTTKRIHTESKAADFDYLFSNFHLKPKHFQRGELWPLMVTCKLPEDYSDQVPDSVALSKNKCDHITNNLRYLRGLYNYY